jgi:hypothetical protein
VKANAVDFRGFRDPGPCRFRGPVGAHLGDREGNDVRMIGKVVNTRLGDPGVANTKRAKTCDFRQTTRDFTFNAVAARTLHL